MALSSSSLIHLTKEKNSLIGILTENFKIKHCVEDLLTPDDVLSYAVPMVSFCDIPMSEIKEHILKYGHYGIGLDKKWAQKNNLNPVFYIDKNSSVGQAYCEAFNDLFKSSDRRITEISETERKLLDVFRYMKNYEADLDRNGEIEHDYRYADEKEWRYVPTIGITQMIYRKDVYLKDKDKFNGLIDELRLFFEPKDIKYVIIKYDHEITEFIRVLKETKRKY